MTAKELAFVGWLGVLKGYLQGKRGRSSALARELGVGRQNVSRWFVVRRSSGGIPAWAAVCANVWYWRVVSSQADKCLSPGGQEGVHHG